jgi:hypothetical protein
MLPIASYNFKAIAEGALSLLPGAAAHFFQSTLGTGAPRYCYSVWLRHLIRTAPYRPKSLDGLVVELGPGDSLGIGLAALLSGASRYVAVDVVRYADVERNLAVLASLVELFAARTPVPNGNEFPEVKPELTDYGFPDALLPPERMARNLDPVRVEAIAAALRGEAKGEPLVRYVNPAAVNGIPAAKASMVFSQAVLEHVDDLPGVYAACLDWLCEGGIMSHQIDFKSHGTSRVWNGHWAYPDPIWRLLRGGRPYLLNREPCRTHLSCLAETGFEVLVAERVRLPSRLRRGQLAVRFRGISDDDICTAGVFLVGKKTASPGRGG